MLQGVQQERRQAGPSGVAEPHLLDRPEQPALQRARGRPRSGAGSCTRSPLPVLEELAEQVLERDLVLVRAIVNPAAASSCLAPCTGWPCSGQRTYVPGDHARALLVARVAAPACSHTTPSSRRPGSVVREDVQPRRAAPAPPTWAGPGASGPREAQLHVVLESPEDLVAHQTAELAVEGLVGQTARGSVPGSVGQRPPAACHFDPGPWFPATGRAPVSRQPRRAGSGSRGRWSPGAAPAPGSSRRHRPGSRQARAASPRAGDCEGRAARCTSAAARV